MVWSVYLDTQSGMFVFVSQEILLWIFQCTFGIFQQLAPLSHPLYLLVTHYLMCGLVMHCLLVSKRKRTGESDWCLQWASLQTWQTPAFLSSHCCSDLCWNHCHPFSMKCFATFSNKNGKTLLEAIETAYRLDVCKVYAFHPLIAVASGQWPDQCEFGTTVAKYYVWCHRNMLCCCAVALILSQSLLLKMTNARAVFSP